MAQNQIPENRGQIGGLGVKMLAGLNAEGESLDITQITAAGFETNLGAFNGAQGVYNQARSSRQSAYNLYHARMTDLDDWLVVVRGILVGDFGNRWTTMWAQAGFVQPSTAIPQRLQDKIALVLKLAQFFTANPSYQVASKNVTAAQATIVRQAVLDAQGALQERDVVLNTALDTLKKAETALVKQMRMLIDILGGLLSKDDPRWEAFGLNRPGMKTTPMAPTGLRATVVGTEIVLENDPTPLATRYRYRRKIVGVDTKYKLVASSRTPIAVLEGVAAGMTMEFIAQAVNGGSQSVASDPIVVTIPAAATPVTAKRAPMAAEAIETKPEAAESETVPLAPLSAIVPNGSGNGNGNGSHAVSRLG